MRTPPSSRSSFPPARTSRRGFTLIETCITLLVLLVAVSIYSKIVLSTKQLRQQYRQRATAARAARTVMEAMIGEEFDEIFVLFNADPQDDPDGKGTAPGNRFRVPGLEPLAGEEEIQVGEIVFPAMMEAGGKAKTLKEKEKAKQGVDVSDLRFIGGQSPYRWELREDFDDFSIGMPRDLNGDYQVDDEDHGEDYVRLPVCIQIEWQGPSGPQRYRVFSILADYTHLDEKIEKDREKAQKKSEKEAK